MAQLLKQSQSFRVESELEVEKFIQEQKTFLDVIGYNVKHKITKDDDYYIVKIDSLHGMENA